MIEPSSKELRLARYHRYYERHKEARNTWQREYYQTHKEQYRRNNARWIAENREQYLAYIKEREKPRRIHRLLKNGGLDVNSTEYKTLFQAYCELRELKRSVRRIINNRVETDA